MSTHRPREDARRTHERPHVLIVTDDEDLADFLSQGLLVGGFWTSVIRHGLQVLEVFRLRRFDLVVIDRELGTFDAVELMERLRGTSAHSPDVGARTLAPMVVIATADSGLDARKQSSLSISAVLQAPVELEDIVRVLHEVFDAWRADHPGTPLADDSPAS